MPFYGKKYMGNSGLWLRIYYKTSYLRLEICHGLINVNMNEMLNGL